MSNRLIAPSEVSLRTVAKAMLKAGLPCLLTAIPCAGQAHAGADFSPSLSKEASRPIAMPLNWNLDTRTNSSSEAKEPRSFAMGEAVCYAMENNASLGSSETQMRASEEGRKAQRGYLGPKLATAYGWFKQTRTTSVQNAQQPPSNGSFSCSLEVSQVLFDSFKNLGAYQKQALQAESDRASLRKNEFEATDAVLELFIDYLCTLELMHSQREAETRQQKQLKIAQAIHKAGLKHKLDGLQAEVELDKSSKKLIASENQRTPPWRSCTPCWDCR